MNNQYNAFHAAEANFYSMISFTQIDYGNLITFASGVPTFDFNPAIIKQVDSSLAASINACNAFYLSKNIPWALFLPDYFHNGSLEKCLQRNGLEFDDIGYAMALRINDIQFPSMKPDLDIRNMKDDLGVWSIPLFHGFESTHEITDVYTFRHQLASRSNKKIYHFSGFVDGMVVCSLSLSIHDNYARIDDVATIPAYQKKGYATQLIYAALKHAQQLKVDTCFLEASTVALTLYKEMGFNELYINRYYYERTQVHKRQAQYKMNHPGLA